MRLTASLAVLQKPEKGRSFRYGIFTQLPLKNRLMSVDKDGSDNPHYDDMECRRHLRISLPLTFFLQIYTIW